MLLKTKRWRCWFSDLDSEKACRLFDAKIITANEWITEDDIAKSLHLLPFTLSTMHEAAHLNRIHLIEFNEVYNVVRETDDQGGLDMFFNPGYRGVVVRHNFWHDIGSENGLGQAGVRLDDAICEVLIYGNVFYRCSRHGFGGVQIHGGKENIVENNLFVDCLYAISFSGWGPDRWKQVMEGDAIRVKLHEDVDITQPPYSTRYPLLAHLLENEGVNSVWSNVVYNCGGFLTRDRGIQDLMDNYVTAQDPGLVNAEKLDFALKPDSPLARGGAFRPIPFGEIGLYEDGLRGAH